MLKKSLFFFEEFSYITSFTANRYSQHDPLRLFDLSTWGQIHNMAGRVLITGWPSTQQSGDSEEIADTCVWLVDIEITKKWCYCNHRWSVGGLVVYNYRVQKSGLNFLKLHLVKSKQCQFYLVILLFCIGRMSWILSNGLEDWGSILYQAIPKTQKMVLDAALLNTQDYKIRIKGKVEQSRE